MPIPEHLEGLSNVKKQRYLKLHPDEALCGKNYDYTVYIDGSCRITCDIKPMVYSMIAAEKTIGIYSHAEFVSPYDEAPFCWVVKNVSYRAIKEQMNFYSREGLPKYTGYYETPVLIRKSGDVELQAVMDTWWEQIKHFTHRDQLSLPYALWKNGKDSSYVFSLGTNVFRCPYFIFASKHKIPR